MDTGTPSKELTVVVVAGAGARGAYEAAAMATLLPELLPNGLGSTVFLGTSAGAINVAMWAAGAGQRDLKALGESVKSTWLKVQRARVFNLQTPQVARWGGEVANEVGRIAFANSVGTVASRTKAGLGFIPGLDGLVSAGESAIDAAVGGAAQVLDIPFHGALAATSGLLDTSPLTQSADELIDFAALNANIQQGLIGGVGLVATSCPMDASGGRSRVFLKTSDGRVPEPEPDSSIDYVRTETITAQHMLASAAIPVAFPSVHIDAPAEFAGWYTDGGVRLNAPIEPAVKLGATRIIVISSHAAEYPPATSARSKPRPGLLDVSAQSLHAIMADGMIEDLRTLRRINKLVIDAQKQSVRLYKRPDREYRYIENVVVAPKNGQISSLLGQAVKEIEARKDGFDNTANRLLSLLSQGDGRNELLSYLMFEPRFFELQFRDGAADAQQKLQALRQAA
jgi:NTE family protein